jgi:hypothetical protein
MANHLTQWKPQVTINNQTTVFSNYAEVKKNMRFLLQRSNIHEVYVSRSRRGCWGEWFEYWGFDHSHKPIIKKQGWL